MADDQPRTINITAVGDGGVGKTYMLIRYITDEIPDDYIPTVFDNYAGSIIVDRKSYNIQIWDTAGQEDYERLRALSYTNTDCFLLCFAIDSEHAYHNIRQIWIKELRHFKQHAPIILVGTKSDLRNHTDIKTFSAMECHKLKEKIRAVTYVECSAFTRDGIDDVFQEAVKAIIYKKKTHIQRRCLLL